MPDRPLHNLTRDHLLGIYEDLQSEPSSKKYNLRKELQTDKRDTTVYANRWLTRDQFLALIHQEILDRGLDVPPAAAPPEPGEPAESSPGAPAVVGTAEEASAEIPPAPPAPAAESGT
ncbi:MAG TPA: hypothetical protein VKY74_22075 [Chloroflexia bacterium]|nr:hypothetical protein [Chloroflexia bacterium]